LRLVCTPLIIAFAMAALVASSPRELEPAVVERDAVDETAPKSWIIADQSCAASNCHGGFTADSEGRRGGHEASVWRNLDPHARAYEVLKTDRAKNMQTILAKHAGIPLVEATKDVRCLACHASPVADSVTAAAHFGDDGVSCRSCHGEASKWLAAHSDSELAGLGKVDDPEKRRKAYEKPAVAGLKFLGTPRLRADTCVGCHVGAKEGVDGLPRREVDHDMIAAGHPRLVFDLASQSSRQPRHWRDRPEQDLPAEWAAGQAAAIRALADLAASRPGGPRLDFADQACLRCHHHLEASAGSSPNEIRSLGKLGWAAPYAPAAAWLSNGENILKGLAEVARAKPAELADALTRLARTARETPSFKKAALPVPGAAIPADPEARLAEYRAWLAADPQSKRLKRLHPPAPAKQPITK
jgi:hypothetical protein